MSKTLLLALLLVLPVTAQIAGKVVGVTDGDTITVLSDKKQIKVRLAGIDAPERGQDFGNASKKHLSDLVLNKSVTLEGTKTDRNGRLIAKVILEGRDVGLIMIQTGYAWHYREYSSEQSAADRAFYQQAEIIARERSFNLWSQTSPIAPWEFRTGARPRQATNVSYPTDGRIIGNKNSRIYHKPGCSSYNKVAPQNRVYFETPLDAEKEGYRIAKNC